MLNGKWEKDWIKESMYLNSQFWEIWILFIFDFLLLAYRQRDVYISIFLFLIEKKNPQWHYYLNRLEYMYFKTSALFRIRPPLPPSKVEIVKISFFKANFADHHID